MTNSNMSGQIAGQALEQTRTQRMEIYDNLPLEVRRAYAYSNIDWGVLPIHDRFDAWERIEAIQQADADSAVAQYASYNSSHK